MPYGCSKWLEYEGIPFKRNAKNTVSTRELIMIIGTLLAFNIVLVYFYRKSLKNELKQEMAVKVNSAVSQYVAINMTDMEEMPQKAVNLATIH